MPALSTSYILPAVFLNPVIVLHTLNSFLCRSQPSYVNQRVSTWGDPATWGYHHTPPYLDVHNNENFCWSYTICMVCVQLFAFSKISKRRGDAREKKEAEKIARELKAAAVAEDLPVIKCENAAVNGTAGANGVLGLNGSLNGVITRNGSLSRKKSADSGGPKQLKEACVERLEQWGRKSDAVAGFVMG